MFSFNYTFFLINNNDCFIYFRYDILLYKVNNMKGKISFIDDIGKNGEKKDLDNSLHKLFTYCMWSSKNKG